MVINHAILTMTHGKNRKVCSNYALSTRFEVMLEWSDVLLFKFGQ